MLFWLGLLVALIGGSVGIGLFRTTAKSRLRSLHDHHLDRVALALLVLGLLLSAVDHWDAEAQLERVRASLAQHEFTALSDSLRRSTLQALHSVGASFQRESIKIDITHETWVLPAVREFAAELAALLRDAGFNVSGPDTATVYLASPSYPIEWGFSAAQEETVNQLFTVLAPIIPANEHHGSRRTFATGRVRIHFAGKPRFRKDGSASFE